MVKCAICGARLEKGMPFCPICGAPLGFPFKLLVIGLGLLGACLLTLYYIPSPYGYALAVPFGILSLLPLGGAGFIVFRKLTA